MASPQLRRDSQQWILDWMARTTGTDRNFGVDHELWPRNVVRSMQMVPKVMEKIGTEQERLAEEAYDAGAKSTARRVYTVACASYRIAQHAIMEASKQKTRLWERINHCYDRIIEGAPYPIERAEIPWDGVTFPGLFHINRHREPAPTILFVPGMDMTKEQVPDPTDNIFLEHGFNVLAIDGPGQGESNERGIHVTDDNYERAGSAAIDWLLERPEVDPSAIFVVGFSMGSYWASRITASDHRVAGLVAAMACFGDKRFIFETDSPHFKQMFMYMSGLSDEEAFDQMASRMTMTGYSERITAPTLLVAGEFDPLGPLEQVWEVYEAISSPKELWILTDEAHRLLKLDALAGLSFLPWALDWLGRAPLLTAGHSRERRLEKGGPGPHAK